MREIHSDWGDWLPRAIADAEPGGLTVWYLGCNGFAVKAADGTTIFVDPYLEVGDPPRTTRMIPVPFEPGDVAAADALLATHEHTDHVDEASQAPLLEATGADFYGPSASVEKTRTEGWRERWDVDTDQFETVAPGESFAVGGIDVTVGPANDPDAEEPVSYVIEHGGRTFAHVGDAKPTAGFVDLAAAHEIDLAAVAFGSAGLIDDKETGEPRRRKWYNDENQAIDCARALETDRLLPTHWDMWQGLTADPTALHHHVSSYEHPRSLEIVQIGDRVDV